MDIVLIIMGYHDLCRRQLTAMLVNFNGARATRGSGYASEQFQQPTFNVVPKQTHGGGDFLLRRTEDHSPSFGRDAGQTQL